MAKREIPEINAGSMADIAFLLLIFFLVTTTMDKDQAYIRSIPKRVEVIFHCTHVLVLSKSKVELLLH
jgi:biopolymer transport protein ExbD